MPLPSPSSGIGSITVARQGSAECSLPRLLFIVGGGNGMKMSALISNRTSGRGCVMFAWELPEDIHCRCGPRSCSWPGYTPKRLLKTTATLMSRPAGKARRNNSPTDTDHHLKSPRPWDPAPGTSWDTTPHFSSYPTKPRHQLSPRILQL